MGATSRRAQKRVVAMLAVAAALVIGAAAFRRDAIVEWWYARALKSTDRAERARAVLALVRLGKWKGPAPAAGRIAAVKLDERLVVIDLGKEKGVSEGRFAAVFRGDRLIAFIEVVKVWDDLLSGAKIVETQGDDRVAVGDAVFIVPDPPKTEPGPAIGPSFPRA